MVIEIRQQVCDGHLLKWLAGAGLAWLEHNADVVNQMNVFPVPDGDTGTNMVLTMRKACSGIAPLNESHVGIVADTIAKGALMGARGNSGVLLSQLWRGFAHDVRGHEVFDADLFVHACQSGVEAAYKAVMKPVEGTILTVAREAVEAIASRGSQERDLKALLELMVESARASLMRTPQLMPLLKDAGVVDSGGMGLVFILEGMLRFLNGETVDFEKEKTDLNGENWQEALVPEDEEGYGYDVQFLMRGDGLNVDAVRAAIDSMGWSTLVVGDERLIKVHVHVHDPGKPISYAVSLGAALDDIVVENMQQQYQEYVVERLARETGEHKSVDGVAVVAVTSGEGLRRLFLNELNAASVIAGGQTMNPSIEDFLSAIDALPNAEIILLPNNSNIIMAARQAASMSPGKKVHLVPSRTIPQGIGAMVAYMNTRESGDLEAISAAMSDAANQIVSGEVTLATRDATIDEVAVRKGQAIGLLDGKLVAVGQDWPGVVLELLRKAHADEYELVTLYYGIDVSLDEANALVDDLSKEFGSQEIVVVNGGQALYPYLISVE